jgi:hypothetical protein
VGALLATNANQRIGMLPASGFSPAGFNHIFMPSHELNAARQDLLEQVKLAFVPGTVDHQISVRQPVTFERKHRVIGFGESMFLAPSFLDDDPGVGRRKIKVD